MYSKYQIQAAALFIMRSLFCTAAVGKCTLTSVRLIYWLCFRESTKNIGPTTSYSDVNSSMPHPSNARKSAVEVTRQWWLPRESENGQ